MYNRCIAVQGYVLSLNSPLSARLMTNSESLRLHAPVTFTMSVTIAGLQVDIDLLSPTHKTLPSTFISHIFHVSYFHHSKSILQTILFLTKCHHPFQEWREGLSSFEAVRTHLKLLKLQAGSLCYPVGTCLPFCMRGKILNFSSF